MPLVLGTPLRAEIVHVDSAGLQRPPAAGAAVVDMRTPEEWSETGTVAGADRPVALIRHGGKRSFKAARLPDGQTGERRVYNVRHGVSGWIAENRSVVAGP